MGIAGPDINYMPCLELEILGGEGIYVSSILTITSFFGHFTCTQRVRKNKKDKITQNFPILTPNCGHLHIVDTFVQTHMCLLFKGFTFT